MKLSNKKTWISNPSILKKIRVQTRLKIKLLIIKVMKLIIKAINLLFIKIWYIFKKKLNFIHIIYNYNLF